ncbi:DEAD/DEAH box helicase [Lamprobacter modestohalophilus]|uniref:ATP-dependent DNA helicase n=1 Tax=Lamprobacter modestohalophilus TaxID=1064514 RepID=UPI002ADEB36D|nr:DEAD/DEAH box helicase [Lamprobacter modestohalophilus]MEA1050477.1 DEAD/DEAH box helicase [Lamprobacter modestohalophilus]
MIALSPDQERALARLHAFSRDQSEHTLALSGPAGSGKSTLIGRFLRETDRMVQLSATTNKAAAVAAALAGEPTGQTIHKLLGLRPVRDYRNGTNKLRPSGQSKVGMGELVLIDEASMVDRTLYTCLLECAEENALQLLFVGDPYQLPPVDDGDQPMVFETTETLMLETVHRQAEQSPVLALATRFRAVLDGADYPVIRPHGEALQRFELKAFGARVRELFSSKDYSDDPDHCRLLAYTNARVHQLNTYVRQFLLGADAKRYAFLPGERLIANEPLIESGEVRLSNNTAIVVQRTEQSRFKDAGFEIPGWQLEIAEAGAGDPLSVFVADDQALARQYLASLKQQALRAKQQGSDSATRAAWQRYFRATEQFADLRPPYASTVHKSQGSTYQHVLIHLEDIARTVDQPNGLLARLLYVSITRAVQSAGFFGRLPQHLYAHGRIAA